MLGRHADAVRIGQGGLVAVRNDLHQIADGLRRLVHGLIELSVNVQNGDADCQDRDPSALVTGDYLRRNGRRRAVNHDRGIALERRWRGALRGASTASEAPEKDSVNRLEAQPAQGALCAR